MQVIINGLLTNYETHGRGQVVLLLHGWGDSSASWRQLAGALAKEYQVIVPDLPGFGASETPKTAWGLDDYAAFCAELLKKLNLGTPAAIIGHSNGGAIAIRGLGAGKLKTGKLVLLASAGIRGEYRGRNRALRLATKTGKQFSRALPKPTRQKLRQKVYKSIGSDMLVAEHLQATFKKIVNDDVRADAAKITAPTLLIYGEQDEQTPPRYGQTFHELIKDSRLKLLPTAGHFLQLDQPKILLSEVKDFIS